MVEERRARDAAARWRFFKAAAREYVDRAKAEGAAPREISNLHCWLTILMASTDRDGGDGVGPLEAGDAIHEANAAGAWRLDGDEYAKELTRRVVAKRRARRQESKQEAVAAVLARIEKQEKENKEKARAAARRALVDAAELFCAMCADINRGNYAASRYFAAKQSLKTALKAAADGDGDPAGAILELERAGKWRDGGAAFADAALDKINGQKLLF